MIPITYILINLIQAIWHSYLIKKNRLILSAQKITEYVILSILAGVILINFPEGKLLPLILFCILTRLAFYDPFLNIIRGKDLFYEGEISKRKSWTDWIENKIGLPIWVFRIFYIVAFFVYLIIYYAN
jgi:hypothetical protein